MRIQVLPLPPKVAADGATETPFVLVFDRLNLHDEEVLSLPSVQDWVRAAWGATALLMTGAGEEIEISPHLDLPDELQQQLIAHLTKETP